MMFDKHANMKHRFGNRKFWAEGCYVSTAGLNGATIAKCIREQEKAGIAPGRPSAKECEDPFDRGPKRKQRRFDRPATGQDAMRPEPREGRRL